MNPSELTFVALLAAQEAGSILQSGFRTTYEIASKPGKQNLVTAYDKASEKKIIEIIRDFYPTHGILAEESGSSLGKNDHPVWIIDPLDGTVNFAHGIPVFAVSIGVAIHNELISGVIYHPLMKELFIAEKKKGAYLNGKRIHVNQKKELDSSLLATGFPYNVDENPHHCIDQFVYFTRKGIPIRRLGCASLDLSYVALGSFSAYWEAILQPWDVAAGQLLVEEAGGQVSDYKGNPRNLFSTDPLLASNKHLHEYMVQHLNQAAAE